MALKNPHDLKDFRNSPLVKVHECTDGFFRYIYGEYFSIEKALEDIQMIKTKGYSDAFIINLNRIKSISMPKYIESKSTNYTGKYTLQLKASKTRLRKNYFNNIDKLKIIEGGDKIFRYIYGEFNTLDDAKKSLMKIRKMGYVDAFIRETDTIPGYR